VLLRFRCSSGSLDFVAIFAPELTV
jgi:hypothetical protein